VRLKLTRAVVIRTLSPPDGLEVACDRVSAACRRYLRTGTERHQPESDLELAMFLGERTRMSEEERTAFQRSGTFHVLVVAGLHVGAVAATFRALLSLLRLPRAPALLTELLLVAGYVAVTGAGLPARRTFIMLVFLESARVLRQPGNSLAAIVLATAATLAIDPQQLFGAGFQLSYAVVTALIVMASPLARRWENAWRPWESLPDADRGWLRSAIRLSGRKICHGAAVSAVALLASAPCMIGNFGVLSLGSLLANLAVVPLAGLVVSAGFWSVVCGGAGWMGGCALFNRAAILLIKAMVGALALGSGLPLGGVAAGFRQPWMMPVATVAIIGSMLIGASLRWRRSAGGFWLPAAVFVLVLLFGVKFGGNAVMVPR
jgi:competence protein ComEC